MKCDHVHVPGGGGAIVCSSGGRGYRSRPHRCGACGRALSATLQCDWKLGTATPPPPGGRPLLGKEGRTCDVHICTACAQEVGPDKHLCPEHQRTYKEWLAQRAPQHSALSTQDSAPERSDR